MFYIPFVTYHTNNNTIMKKTILILLLSVSASCFLACDTPFSCYNHDLYSITNNTDKDVALMVIIDGCINDSPDFTIEDTVLYLAGNGNTYTYKSFTIISHPGESIDTAIYIMMGEEDCDGKDRPHYLYYTYGNGARVYNLTDTTSIELLYQPYENPWFDFVWYNYCPKYVNHYHLTMTNDKLSEMQKDYSMLTRFADYYSQQ